MKTLLATVALLLLSLVVFGQNAVYEVIWSPAPYRNFYHRTAPGPVTLQSATYGVGSWFKAHAATGEITIYEGLTREVPIPRERDSLEEWWYNHFPEMYGFDEEDDWGEQDEGGEEFDGEDFEDDGFGGIDYVYVNEWEEFDAVDAHVLLQERWEVKNGVLSRSNLRVVLDMYVPFADGRPKLFRVAESLEDIPRELLYFGEWDMHWIQQESLSQALERQRMFTHIVAYKEESEEFFTETLGYRNCIDCANQTSDSLLQSWGYMATVPTAKQVDKWYPIQTKTNIELRMERDWETDIKKMPSSQRRINVFLEEGIPQIMEGLKVGQYAAYHPDSLTVAYSYDDVLDRMWDFDYSWEEEDSFEDGGFEDFDGEGEFNDEFDDVFLDEWEEGEDASEEVEPSLVPYQDVFQTRGSMTRKKKKVSYSADYLFLIWRDPARSLPENYLCAFRILDLEGIKVEGKPLRDWLNKYKKLSYYPVRVRTGLTSLYEAELMKNLLEKGRWDLLPTEYDRNEGLEAYYQRIPEKLLPPQPEESE